MGRDDFVSQNVQIRLFHIQREPSSPRTGSEINLYNLSERHHTARTVSPNKDARGNPIANGGGEAAHRRMFQSVYNFLTEQPVQQRLAGRSRIGVVGGCATIVSQFTAISDLMAAFSYGLSTSRFPHDN